jgi:hypothetical protein
MPVDPPIQAKFERNLIWKRSWPRCFFGLAATLEIFLGLVNHFSFYLLSNLHCLGNFSIRNSQYFNGFLAYEYFRWYMGIAYYFC